MTIKDKLMIYALCLGGPDRAFDVTYSAACGYEFTPSNIIGEEDDISKISELFGGDVEEHVSLKVLDFSVYAEVYGYVYAICRDFEKKPESNPLDSSIMARQRIVYKCVGEYRVLHLAKVFYVLLPSGELVQTTRTGQISMHDYLIAMEAELYKYAQCIAHDIFYNRSVEAQRALSRTPCSLMNGSPIKLNFVDETIYFNGAMLSVSKSCMDVQANRCIMYLLGYFTEYKISAEDKVANNSNDGLALQIREYMRSLGFNNPDSVCDEVARILDLLGGEYVSGFGLFVKSATR